MAIDKTTLPHVALIAKAEIKKRDFNNDLNNMIASFDRRFSEWCKFNSKKYELNDEKAMKAYETFLSESTIIAQHIYDYFVEEEDQIAQPSVVQAAAQIQDAIADPAPATDPPPVSPVTPSDPVNATPASPPIPPATPSDPPPAANADPEPDETNERALHKLYKEGKLTEISRETLKSAGFNTSWWGDLQSTGQRCGKYRLYKEKSERLYSLEKIG